MKLKLDSDVILCVCVNSDSTYARRWQLLRHVPSRATRLLLHRQVSCLLKLLWMMTSTRIRTQVSSIHSHKHWFNCSSCYWLLLIHTHTFIQLCCSGHFSRSTWVGQLPLDFRKKRFWGKFFMCQMPFLSPTSRNTLGFAVSASSATPEGKGTHTPC